MPNPRNQDNKPSAADEDDAPAAESGGQDARVAAAAGLTEGELRELRSNAAVNLLAGHESNVLAWESTQEGQVFLRSEDDRKKAIEAEVKAVEESSQEVEENQRKYDEAVKSARSTAVQKAKDTEKSR